MDTLIIFCAKYVIVLVVLLWAVAWYLTPKGTKLKFVLATVLAGIIAVVLSRIASKLYYDPRPFVSHHVTPLISHAADNGFPSDHALFTMTLTAITFFFNKKVAAGMLVGTILVSGARVLAHVHSPLDIAGAWVLGIVGAVAGFYLASWAWGKYSANRQVPPATQSMHE